MTSSFPQGIPQPDAYDLYYWMFDKMEVRDLPGGVALSWIDHELRQLGYADPLKNGIAREVVRLTTGNPGAVTDTLSVMRDRSAPLDDPIRIRRVFVEGRIRHSE